MRFYFTSLFIAVLLLINGCQPPVEKVSKEEAVQFAADLEASATKRRDGFLSSNIIISELMKRFDDAKKIKNWDDTEEGIRAALQKHELDKSLFQVMGKNGTFEKVKLYEKDGMQRVVFRGYGDGGFNYLDMELVKVDKKVGIADMYIFFTGENFSTTMAVLIDKLEKVSESSDKYLSQRLTSVKSLLKQEDYEAAKTQFNYLPASVKATTAGVSMNLQILTKLQDESSMKELDVLEKRYGSTSFFQLMMLDVYTVQKKYDKAINSINQLDSLIDKDPFLDYYRGLFAYMKGDNPTAINYYQKVTVSNPAFPGAYAELVALLALKEDKAAATKYFSIYKKLRNKDQDIVKNFRAAYPYLDAPQQ